MELERKNTTSPLEGLQFTQKTSESGRERGQSGAIDINCETHKTRSGTIDISKMTSNGSTVTLGTADTTLSGNTGMGSNMNSAFAPHTPSKAITYAAHEHEMDGALSAKSPKAATKLAEALSKLREVDMILEQLSVFWANTEVVLDLLTKKGQHVEQFIGFSTKPKLMARFRERIEEYKRFWEGVSLMSSNYISGVNSTGSTGSNDGDSAGGSSSFASNPQKMYGFLEKEGSSEHTPPRSTFKDKRYENATPPNVAGNLGSRVEEANSFDSLGGVFKTVNSTHSNRGAPM
jgi:hypothetical protein